MAKTGYTQYTAVSNQLADPDSFNAFEDEVQAEFEERFDNVYIPGVISGLTPSISTTNIAIASGDGYGSDGYRYIGSASIAFSGSDAAGTYYVYWDTSAQALAKSTTEPDRYEDLELCSVYWNGADTLSSLVDLRPLGVIQCLIAESFTIATVTTGIKSVVPIYQDCWIDYVKIVQSSNGVLAATVVDVHSGNSGSSPTTIFTTTQNRPSVNGTVAAYTVTTCGVPDTRTLTAGQVLTIEVDSTGGDAQNLGVRVYGRYR